MCGDRHEKARVGMGADDAIVPLLYSCRRTDESQKPRKEEKRETYWYDRYTDQKAQNSYFVHHTLTVAFQEQCMYGHSEGQEMIPSPPAATMCMTLG